MRDQKIKGLTAQAKKAFRRARRPLLPGASNRRLIRELLPEILRKREEGWTYAQLRQALADTFNCTISSQTLAVYVSQMTRAASVTASDAPPDSDNRPLDADQ